MESYKTIKTQSEYIESFKKSRFISRGFSIVSESDALNKINAVKKFHKDATHNCYAYSVFNSNVQGFSDDGEPQGTAGAPILDHINRLELKDTLIVVTRYFGGTLLGTGGLVRAYGSMTKNAINCAGIVTMTPTTKLLITLDYPSYKSVTNYINSIPYARIHDSQYGANITIEVLAKTQSLGVFIKNMEDIQKRQFNGIITGELYLPW